MITSDAPANAADGLESPALRALLTELGGGAEAGATLERFWREVEAGGTPLIEEHDEKNGTALATFLWRDAGNLDNVVLLEWMTGNEFHEKLMSRLAGTDIWYRSLRLRDDLRTSYGFGPNDSLKSRAEETDWPARFAKWRRDPRNRNPLVDSDDDLAGDPRYRATSTLEMPKAPPQPWIVRKPGVPAGSVEHRRFASEILGNERDIWIYRPAGDPGKTPPLVVTFDGENHHDILRLPVVFDNLAASGEIPLFYGVAIGNVDRGAELPCNKSFLAMLTTELVPWLSRHLTVEFAPERTVVNGVSYGGLAAMYCGIFAPETFGLVHSQSGSFWWKPDPLNQERPLRLGDAGDYCWLPAQAATAPLGEIRVWMEAGTLEDRAHGSAGPSLLTSNRHMRDVLIARGVPVIYREFVGGHDWACWRNSLADGLIALLGRG